MTSSIVGMAAISAANLRATHPACRGNEEAVRNRLVSRETDGQRQPARFAKFFQEE